jgi:hypothetical protein
LPAVFFFFDLQQLTEPLKIIHGGKGSGGAEEEKAGKA